jgi:hypothetical protein
MRRLLVMLLGLALFTAGLPDVARGAVMQENFHVKTAADLVALCSAEESEQLATSAVVFCHGYAVGVYQTLVAEQAGMRTKLFCIPDPAPSRTEAITAFVSWAKTSPALLGERAPDALLGYLMQRFPCPGGEPSTMRK